MNANNINTQSTKMPVEELYRTLLADYPGYLAKNKAASLALLTARSIYQSKSDYKPEQFREYCTALGFQPGSDQLEKLIAIGAHAERLENFDVVLPPTLDGLHLLSLLPDETLHQVACALLLNPGGVTPASQQAAAA